MMDDIVGIDLGTTNSEIALYRGGRPEILADEQGRKILPSVVGVPVAAEAKKIAWPTSRVAKSCPPWSVSPRRGSFWLARKRVTSCCSIRIARFDRSSGVWVRPRLCGWRATITRRRKSRRSFSSG